MTTRSKLLPTQSQAIEIPRELLPLYEEVETSLDGFHANGQLIVASISHEICHIIEIPNDETHNQIHMNAVDEMLQVCCKYVFYVAKLNCDK